MPINHARLLIVEDNEEIAQMLVLFLGGRGFKVYVAPDGETARKLVREFLPTLILLDIGLPDIDGFTLLQQFRQSARTRFIPVIFLTQRNRKIDRLAGLELGVDDFISKPFDLEELYLRLMNTVQHAEREQLSNVQTGLPAGEAVRRAIEEAKARPFGRVLKFRMRYMNEFRDLYGLLAGIDVLRYTALLLNRVLNTIGTQDDFLGQIDEETFIITTSAERAEAIRKDLLDRFNNDVLQHYSLPERDGDKVRVRTPSGAEYVLPILALELMS